MLTKILRFTFLSILQMSSNVHKGISFFKKKLLHHNCYQQHFFFFDQQTLHHFNIIKLVRYEKRYVMFLYIISFTLILPNVAGVDFVIMNFRITVSFREYFKIPLCNRLKRIVQLFSI